MYGLVPGASWRGSAALLFTVSGAVPPHPCMANRGRASTGGLVSEHAGDPNSSFARTLAPVVLGGTVVALPVYLVGGLAAELQTALQLSPEGLGAVISLYFLGAALGSIPLGRLTEAVGARRVMRTACLTSGALSVFVSLGVDTWQSLAAVMVPAGAASSAMQLGTNQYIARRIPYGHQGLAFGIKQAAIPLSALLGGLAVPFVALTVGWRWAFTSAAAAALLVSFLLPRPKSSWSTYRAQRSRIANARGGVLPLVVLALGAGLAAAAATSMAGFLALSIVSAGAQTSSAGVLLALGGFSAALVRILVGMHADRHGNHLLPLVMYMLILGSCGLLMFSLFASSSMSWLLIPAVLLAFGAGWGWNGLLNLAVIHAYLDQPARATGVTQVGVRLGGVGGPVIFGLVAIHASYAMAWLCSAAATLVSAAAILAGHTLMSRRDTSE